MPASVSERDWGEIGSSGNIVMPWEASNLIASSWGVEGLGQVSSVSDMRGMDVMGSEVIISPGKDVEAILLVCSDKGVRN